MPTCSECHAELPASARFCPRCAAPTPRALDLPDEGDLSRTEEYTPERRTPVHGVASPGIASSGRPAGGAQAGTGTVEIGTIVNGRYRILDRLGGGNMGSVYRAQDLTLGEDVALKFFSPQCAIDADCTRLLIDEVKLGRQVTHPNVCRVHDIAEYDGRTFISMEYVDGEDLSSLLHRIGHVHGTKAHQIARQLCAGLHAAHERGVLHRDLKPANVMLDSDGNVRIADFGIAAAVGAEGDQGIRGTPAYMAPELFTGTAASVQSDLFSLGLVLYELYTGKRLFDASSMTELLDQHRSVKPSVRTLVRDVDPAVEDVITALLQRDPDRRPPSAMATLARLPGGDPLAAALAAGETPSPELVAGAGGASTVSFRAALAMVAFIAAGWLCACWVGTDVKLLGRVDLPQSGPVLAHTAEAIVQQLFAPTPAERRVRAAAWRFDRNEAYIAAIYAHDTRPDRWEQRLALQRPALVDFWYRWNPQPIQPTNIKGRVTWDDPPFVTPGMTRLRLDPHGRLLELERLPERLGDFAPPSGGNGAHDPPWKALLAAAGLDLAELGQTEPRLVPAAPFTERAAWRGEYPESGLKIRVEAAALDGLPVGFYIHEERGLGDGDDLVRHRHALPHPPTWRFGAMVLLILVAIAMAWHALSTGRSDRRGATRLGVVTVILVVTFTLLTGDHNGHLLGFGQLVLKGMSHGVLVGGQLAVFYLALEPHVRRNWPETMIAWSRLLAGRAQDSLVGHHVLVGLVIGIGATLFQMERHVLTRWAGAAEGPPTSLNPASIEALRGPIPAVGSFLELVVDLGRESMKCLLALVLLNLLLRSRRLAAVAVIAVFTLVWMGEPRGDTLWVGLSVFGTAALVAAFVYALVRHGIVAMMVALIVFGFLVDFPLTLDPDRWYAGSTMLSFLVIGGASFQAFRCATRFARRRGTG